MDEPSSVQIPVLVGDNVEDRIIKIWRSVIAFMVAYPQCPPHFGVGYMFCADLFTHQHITAPNFIRRLFEHPLFENVLMCANTSWQIEIVSWAVRFSHLLDLNKPAILATYETRARNAILRQRDLIEWCQAWMTTASNSIDIHARVLSVNLKQALKDDTKDTEVFQKFASDLHITKPRSASVGESDESRGPWPEKHNSARIVQLVMATRANVKGKDATRVNICDIPLDPYLSFLDKNRGPYNDRLKPSQGDARIDADLRPIDASPRTKVFIVAHIRHLNALWRESVQHGLLAVVFSAVNWKTAESPLTLLPSIVLSPEPFNPRDSSFITSATPLKRKHHMEPKRVVRIAPRESLASLNAPNELAIEIRKRRVIDAELNNIKTKAPEVWISLCATEDKRRHEWAIQFPLAAALRRDKMLDYLDAMHKNAFSKRLLDEATYYQDTYAAFLASTSHDTQPWEKNAVAMYDLDMPTTPIINDGVQFEDFGLSQIRISPSNRSIPATRTDTDIDGVRMELAAELCRRADADNAISRASDGYDDMYLAIEQRRRKQWVLDNPAAVAFRRAKLIEYLSLIHREALDIGNDQKIKTAISMYAAFVGLSDEASHATQEWEYLAIRKFNLDSPSLWHDEVDDNDDDDDDDNQAVPLATKKNAGSTVPLLHRSGAFDS